MTMTFDQWKADVTGKTIGTGQCVALAEDYIIRVVGSTPVNTNNGTPHAGYAIASWDGGKTPANMSRIKASDARRGDVLFWNGFSPATPFTMLSHVAVADGPIGLGVTVPVVSQNSPRPVATQQFLPALGLAGAWRWDTNPDAGGTGNPLEAIQPPSLGDITAGVGGLMNGLSGVNKVLSRLNDPKLWQRVGLYALGAVLLLIAFAGAFKDTPTAAAISKGLKP